MLKKSLDTAFTKAKQFTKKNNYGEAKKFMKQF